MSITINAPAIMGGTIKLTGDVVGSFLLHRSSQPTFTPPPEDSFKYLWCVTHVATGMKFPWEFPTKKTARAFAKAVESVLDWSAVKVEIRKSGPANKKGHWIAGRPTNKQNAAIHTLAETHGAMTE